MKPSARYAVAIFDASIWLFISIRYFGSEVKGESRGQSKFLVFQDNPGEGFQANIFKRFCWWEDECTQRMMDKFGITLLKKSFKAFGAKAKEIPDAEVRTVWKNMPYATAGVPDQGLSSAIKVYLAIIQELDADECIRSVGINCLNESHYSDTAPCLA